MKPWCALYFLILWSFSCYRGPRHNCFVVLAQQACFISGDQLALPQGISATYKLFPLPDPHPLLVSRVTALWYLCFTGRAHHSSPSLLPKLVCFSYVEFPLLVAMTYQRPPRQGFWRDDDGHGQAVGPAGVNLFQSDTDKLSFSDTPIDYVGRER